MTERRQQMKADRHGTGTFTEQCHFLSVSAERVDVLLDPVQSHQLVVESSVTGRLSVTTQAEEAKCADPVTHLRYSVKHAPENVLN